MTTEGAAGYHSIMVTIELSEETANALEAKAAKAGLDLAGYLAKIAEVTASVDTSKLSVEEKLRAWQQMIDSIPPGDHFVDDSRESIYPDRN